MTLGTWRTPEGLEIEEIIGCTDRHGNSTQTVYVHCSRTGAGVHVDPPTLFERLRGVTFANKLWRAIDKVQTEGNERRLGWSERRAACAGIATILGAEPIKRGRF